MNDLDEILDDAFHGAAWPAYFDEAAQCRGVPDSDRVRRRAYRYYEEALAAKNASVGGASIRPPPISIQG